LKTLQVLAAVLLSAWLNAGPLTAAEKIKAEPSKTARTIEYHTGDIAPIYVLIGYPTLVSLPSGERAVVPICANCHNPVDKEEVGDWLVEPIQGSNLVAIKSTKAGAKTVVHVLGESGTVYSFALDEVSQTPDLRGDVRVLVTTSDASLIGAINGRPQFVTADEAEHYKAQAAEAEKALRDEKAATSARLAQEKEAARAQAEAGIKHTYAWQQNAKATATFGVRSIYEDSGFTVIEATPQEAPSMYEVRDGKDSLIEFQFVNGKYVAPKVIYDGYMRVGKSKLTFHREG
jgi:hypothetical protein